MLSASVSPGKGNLNETDTNCEMLNTKASLTFAQKKIYFLKEASKI